MGPWAKPESSILTHIVFVKVILQLKQVGLDEPWPLEIVDFTGKRKEIILEEGEILL